MWQEGFQPPRGIYDSEIFLNYALSSVEATTTMARKPSRGSNLRAPFSASSTAPAKQGKAKSKSKRKLDPTNAYTYLPSLPKRSRTSEAQLSLSRDESGPSERRRRHDQNEEENENEAMEERIKKLGMMIADEEVGNVDSDESDIDSDEAWGDDGSDEERWGDVFRDLEKGKKQGKGKGKEVVLKVCLMGCKWYVMLTKDSLRNL